MIVVGVILLLYALALYIRGRVVLKYNHLTLIEKPQPERIAVLIAARDESKVIEGLLSSLQAQTVNLLMQDIYVVVEDKNDPTVKICQKYGVSFYVRTQLEGRRRKGYALDDVVKHILFTLKKQYDLYFVFDADNILADDYIETMLKSYRKGYEMATGYRNSKNANDNVIAAVSSLTFSMINVIENRNRSRHGGNVVFSGTGFYVDGSLVEEWAGWPFHQLTEDYEMSLYATWRGLKTFYNEQATFYDEQPDGYRQTVDQRVRWIRGYFDARKIYLPLIQQRLAELRKKDEKGQNYGSLVREVIGVRSVIWFIVGLILLLVGGMTWLISYGLIGWALMLLIGVLGIVYVVLMMVTIMLVLREKIRLKPAICVKAILFNPVYLVSYVPCALKALLAKEITWKKIDHNKTGAN